MLSGQRLLTAFWVGSIPSLPASNICTCRESQLASFGVLDELLTPVSHAWTAQANGKQNLWGTETAEDVRLDEAKLKAAMARQRAFDAAKAEPDERKRKYNSLAGGEEVSAEDMEAYRVTRVRADDPMAKYLASRDDE